MKPPSLIILAAVFAAVGILWHPAISSPASGFDPTTIPGAKILSGTVSYRERTELPQTAMVHVELVDLSQKDLRKSVLGEDTIWSAGIRPPITFRIPYDPTRIVQEHIYIVRARITDGEKTLFVSSSLSPVLTKGAPATADIIVIPVSFRFKQP